jgi:hypothetical protein
VIAIFVVVLLLLQRSDLDRAAAHDDEAELWASLAIEPIDANRPDRPLRLLPRNRPRRRARAGVRADGPGDVAARSAGDGAAKGGFEPRSPTMPGFEYRLRGSTELSGERHGRQVTIRFGGHEDAGHSEVEIAAPCHPFEASGGAQRT